MQCLEVEVPPQVESCPEAAGWVQLNIAWAGERGQAGPLFRGLGEALQRWRSRGSVERWFVRKSPGLRLRVRGPGFDDDARIELEALIERERRAGRVERCWRSTYEPERDRLGGDAVLPAVHALFSADTDVWSAWIELDALGRTRLESAWMTLALAGDLLRRGTESYEEAWAIWAALHRLYLGKPPLSPAGRARVSLADPAALVRRASLDEHELLTRGFEANTQMLAALREAERNELLVGGARALLATLVGFHWNRWGLDPPTIASLCAAMVADLHPTLAFIFPEAS
jgi:thiopeptide-type bacteriocin biosynthesis protein